MADNTGASCAGEKVTGGRNLTGDETCPGITGPRLLGPLRANGGVTKTRALGAGSAAINPGLCDTTVQFLDENTIDQRGIGRDGSLRHRGLRVGRLGPERPRRRHRRARRARR